MELERPGPLFDEGGLRAIRSKLWRVAIVAAAGLALAMLVTVVLFDPRDRDLGAVDPEQAVYRHHLGSDVDELRCGSAGHLAGGGPSFACSYRLDGSQCSATVSDRSGIEVDRCRGR